MLSSSLSSVVCPLSSVLCPLSSVVCPLSSLLCRLSSVVCALSSALCPLPSVLLLASANNYLIVHFFKLTVVWSVDRIVLSLPRLYFFHFSFVV